jgi:LPS-assembly lipoprotein
MSSSSASRRRLVGLAAVALPGLAAGCNLRPLHARRETGDVNTALAAITVETPRSSLGRLMREELEVALNPAGVTAPAVYTVDVQLERFSDALAIQLDDTTTRYNLIISARYQLRRRVDNAVVYRSAARRVASYNVVRAPYATLVAEQDAERRAVAELAQEIRTRLAIQLERGSG